MIPIRTEIDGTHVEGEVEPRTNLADFLRDDLAITGVRIGCEQGVCGSCTVLVDGRSQRSCLTLAAEADETVIETVAGLGEELAVIQAAFSRHFAIQCGFCASGVLVTVLEFLRGAPKPDEADVRQMLSGNICRCTGYEGMVRAILELCDQG